MAWIVEDRLKQYQPTRSEPYLTAEIKAHIERQTLTTYFPDGWSRNSS